MISEEQRIDRRSHLIDAVDMQDAEIEKKTREESLTTMIGSIVEQYAHINLRLNELTKEKVEWDRKCLERKREKLELKKKNQSVVKRVAKTERKSVDAERVSSESPLQASRDMVKGRSLSSTAKHLTPKMPLRVVGGR